LLRTLSFVLTPMLSGIGEPGRGLAYNVIAAVLLPLAFVVGARLWPEGGYLAVAWGWALGDALAFIALLALELPAIELSMGAYLRGALGVSGGAGAALVVGLIVRALVPA